MIIISQDGMQIINFNKTFNVWIEEDGEKEGFCITADGETLGIYKTEERAKEVLEEISFAKERNVYRMLKE